MRRVGGKARGRAHYVTGSRVVGVFDVWHRHWKLHGIWARFYCSFICKSTNLYLPDLLPLTRRHTFSDLALNASLFLRTCIRPAAKWHTNFTFPMSLAKEEDTLVFLSIPQKLGFYFRHKKGDLKEVLVVFSQEIMKLFSWHSLETVYVMSLHNPGFQRSKNCRLPTLLVVSLWRVPFSDSQL